MPVDLLHFDGSDLARARRRPRRRRARVRLGRPADGAAAAARRRRCPPARTTELHAQARSLRRHARPSASSAARSSSSTTAFPRASTTTRSGRGGTLMCHRAHRADTDPLVDVGLKDITAAPRLHRRSPSPARTPGSTSSATRRRRASSSTAASASCSREADAARARRCAQAPPRARDGRAVQGARLRQGRERSRRSASPAATGATGSSVQVGRLASGTRSPTTPRRR